MEKVDIQGISLYYEDENKDSLELVQTACKDCIDLMKSKYGIRAPKDCRVYIMTAWRKFLFHSAPWLWKVYLALSFPFWVRKVKTTWQLAGGWAQNYHSRQAVGVKPPHLLASTNHELGDQLFIRWDDLEKSVQSVTCHELTHAFTAHLYLPPWLNEGLAMNMVDQFFQEETVKSETLERLKPTSMGKVRGKMDVSDPEALLMIYIRGYWLTRYIEETNPTLLKRLLSQHYQHKELKKIVADAYAMGFEEFWGDIDNRLVSYFT